MLGQVGFGVLTAVVMKSVIYWDTVPCSQVKLNLHLQGRRRSQARSQHESDRKQISYSLHNNMIIVLEIFILYNIATCFRRIVCEYATLSHKFHFYRRSHCYMCTNNLMGLCIILIYISSFVATIVYGINL
jgi:archaellum biogenesis protein FlaJ (TadC family)